MARRKLTPDELLAKYDPFPKPEKDQEAGIHSMSPENNLDSERPAYLTVVQGGVETTPKASAEMPRKPVVTSVAPEPGNPPSNVQKALESRVRLHGAIVLMHPKVRPEKLAFEALAKNYHRATRAFQEAMKLLTEEEQDSVLVEFSEISKGCREDKACKHSKESADGLSAT